MVLEKVFPKEASKEELIRLGAVEQKPKGQLEGVISDIMVYQNKEEGVIVGWVEKFSGIYIMLYQGFVGDSH